MVFLRDKSCAARYVRYSFCLFGPGFHESANMSSDQSAPLMTISQRAMARRPIAVDGQGSAEAPYLEALNPEQRDAALTIDGPVLVLAGAGTGKTKVLTARLAHILATGKARPWEILSVTFTNKAAREMRDRTEAIVGPGASGLKWLGTFHSTSAMILRRHAELAGLKSNFTVLDTDDQIRLMKQVIEAANIDQKRWTPRYLASLIDGWKNRALTPDKVPVDEAYLFASGKGATLYATYQQRLKVLNCVDFGDLLLETISIFKSDPDLLAEYHDRFKYILVDEYQDTNVAQYLWLRLLAQKRKNLCVVGDDDQSIYGWRGAEVDNILRFEKDFPGAKVVRLERNYRSTPHILAAASHLIASNKDRLGKTLWTDIDQGERVLVRGVWDGEAEARLIADDIEQWKRNGRRYGEAAVMVRASWQMRAFEERFLMLQIPYKVIGGPRFFERAEIRDAHAYLRLVRSPADDLAFERVVNQPKRGVGDTSLQRIASAARAKDMPLYDMASALILTDDLKGQARTGLRRFIDQLDHWRKKAATMPHTELAETILEESGYTDMLKADKSPQAASKLDNLKELVRSMGQFDTLAAYLEHIELVMDLDREVEGDAVQVLTLHAAKGLEWPLAFLPGWEEEVFPSKRALDEKGDRALEEERRLAYVGITRARESARISFAANRQIYGRWTSVLPSRFIDELPDGHVDAVSDTGYFNQGVGGRAERFAAYGPLSVEPGSGFGAGYESPGWKRAQAANAAKQSAGTGWSKGPVIEGEARLVAKSGPNDAKFALGQRVFHDKFGYGKVTFVEGSKLTIAFELSGEKKVIDTFVKAA
jgi:DNA helicase II / ATP-dependent DNA helicase PcrA